MINEGGEKMKKYRVTMECDFEEFEDFQEASNYFEFWKDELMNDGVVAEETIIEFIESEDDFKNEKIIKKLVAVIDDDRHELGKPRDEGFDWDYWAKWQDVTNNALIK